jgi:hypothetical protein
MILETEIQDAAKFLNILYKAKRAYSKDLEEKVVQDRTSFSEEGWFDEFKDTKLPYTKEEAEEMNESPETARKQETKK